MRKKLIELLCEFHLNTNGHICDGCGSLYAEKVCADIADHLIANGVTIPTRCKDCAKEWCYLRQELGPEGFCSAGEMKP
jgi:hypothetical protein